jgi:hypothetical protein
MPGTAGPALVAGNRKISTFSLLTKTLFGECTHTQIKMHNHPILVTLKKKNSCR